MFWNPPILQRQSIEQGPAEPHPAESRPAACLLTAATYQTKPNLDRHSNSILLRLTLVKLTILRTLLMVRTVPAAFLLVALMVPMAYAVRPTPVQTRAHATITKAPLHKAHRPSARTPKTAKRNAGRTTSHRSGAATHSPRSNRTSYRRYRTRAHFQPISTTTTARRLRIPSPRVSPPPVPTVNSTSTRPENPDTDIPESANSESPNSESANMDTSPTQAPPTSQPAAINPADASIGSTVEIEHPIAPSSGTVASLHKPKMMFASPLRGSRDSLIRQNERSEADYLERIEDDADLSDRISRGLLVPVPESAALAVNGNLPQDRRYCRPWTAVFLKDLARAHDAQFHTPIMVSSAVRTVQYQKQLRRINGNAADAEGDVVSPHLTGATIDIAKSGLTRRELAWMRVHLLTIQNAGKIDVEEEFRQACFHITVYRSYVHTSRATNPRRLAESQSVNESVSSIDQPPPILLKSHPNPALQNVHAALRAKRYNLRETRILLAWMRNRVLGISAISPAT